MMAGVDWKNLNAEHELKVVLAWSYLIYDA